MQTDGVLADMGGKGRLILGSGSAELDHPLTNADSVVARKDMHICMVEIIVNERINGQDLSFFVCAAGYEVLRKKANIG